MTKEEKLAGVFRVVFDDPELRVTPETTALDVDGWDSLSHVNLIVAVEAAFGIRFSPREVLGFKNVGDLLRAVEARAG